MFFCKFVEKHTIMDFCRFFSKKIKKKIQLCVKNAPKMLHIVARKVWKTFFSFGALWFLRT